MQNSVTLEEAAQFRKELLEAFPVEDQPGDDNIVNPEWLKHRTSEEFEIWNYLRGKSWSQVTEASAREKRVLSLLPILLPEAYRYYLPAFMMMSVESLSRKTTVVDAALHSLMPSNSSGASDYDRGRLLPFSGAQRECVLRFLDFLARDESLVSASQTKQAVEHVRGLWR